MRILITGGAGFVGSHLCHRLGMQGHELCVIDDLSRGSAEHLPPSCELIEKDVRSEAALAHLTRWRPAAVVHLAAQINVRSSQHDPVFDAEANVVGTIKLLQAAQQAQVSCFALASSGGAIYGDDCPRPTPEENVVCRPQSPYGVSKLAAELYLEMFCRQGSMRGLALRLGNVYGPGQNTAGESGVVGLFIDALLTSRQVTVVGDGKQTRDYIYVSDVVEAIGRAVEHPSAAGPINIASSEAIELSALLQKLEHIVGRKAIIDKVASRGHEVRHSQLDTQHARQTLGWRPEIGLDEGLALTVEARRHQKATAHPSRQKRFDNASLERARIAPS